MRNEELLVQSAEWKVPSGKCRRVETLRATSVRLIAFARETRNDK